MEGRMFQHPRYQLSLQLGQSQTKYTSVIDIELEAHPKLSIKQYLSCLKRHHGYTQASHSASCRSNQESIPHAPYTTFESR